MIVGFNNYKNKYQFKVTGIIHVGAHVGQEYEEYMATFGPVETHWFEPVESVFSKLSENLSGKPGVNFYNLGLGEDSFTTKMFVDSGNDAQSSSILKPKLHTEEFPHIEFPESSQIEIKVEKLDNFFIESCNMLVLDTQGYELNVLKGSVLTLKNIDYIFTEFNTIEMYENCPKLEDIDNFLREFGFERLETWYTTQNWGDAMYIKNKNYTLNTSINNCKLSVTIPCYKHKDYLRECLESVIKQQTNFNFEVLIRDDYSCDGSEELINEIINENQNVKISFKCFKSYKNWGGSKNIKYLFLNCVGEYIAYLDGDDFFCDELKLQKQVEFLDSNPDYSLHSTSSLYLDKNGDFINKDFWKLNPIKKKVSLEDILDENIISFGRVFRKSSNLFIEDFGEFNYHDWVLNYKTLKNGLAHCADWVGGAYRNTGEGQMTKLKTDKIVEINRKIKKTLIDYHYKKESNKSIVIIDCFVSDKNVESDLINQIEKIKKQNLDILLISNTIVSTDIQQKVDYFIYDKRNQLFQYEYTNLEEIILKDYVYIDKDWQFTTNIVTNGLQRHGLSVLVNLFNAVKFAKSIGYENFWRVEVDDFFCDESLKFIKSCPDLINSEDKKAILYYNSNNISFHFMFWNIDYFLEKIPQIRNEEDYKNLILKNFDSLNFIIAEEFIWKFLKINGDSDVLVKDGENMSLQFPNTVWNTNMSLSNMSPKYENCPSLIFKMNNKSGLFIFTKNYSNDFKSRRIVVYYSDYTETIVHETPEFNTWCWNIVSENAYKYEVYENERLLYVEDCSKIKNFVEFP